MKYTPTLGLLLFFLISFRPQAQDSYSYAVKNTKTVVEGHEERLPIFEFAAYSQEYALNAITKEMAGSHLFGDLIAKKLYLLDQKYTTQEEIVPGNSQTNTEVQKPVIYEAVKHLERYLKKSVKKGDLPLETAISNFNIVLDVALNTRNADTKAFEKAISGAADEAAKLDIFTRRVSLKY